LWWHKTVNGFTLHSTNNTERTFVFACAHFDWEARRCDSYESRPGMCRDYPRALLDQSAPVLFPNCGYRALATNRGQLVYILDAPGLGAEQVAKLKKGLYLEDD
jgi:Fe-S-cluster containining protein